MENILLLILILEIAIVGIVACVIYAKKQKSNSAGIYTNGLIHAKEVFEKELKDSSIKFANEMAALKFFEQLNNTEIDIVQICNESQKRALVLSVKCAETAVALCERSLSKIRSSITESQSLVAAGVSSQCSVVSKMKEQEDFAMKHLEVAQMRLSKLIELGQSA